MLNKLTTLCAAVFIAGSVTFAGDSLTVPADAAHPRQEISPDVTAARAVLARVIGNEAQNIAMTLIPAEAKCDVYEYEAKGGVLALRGSSPVAICRGFYDYAKANGMGMMDWAEGCHFRIPKTWPDAPKTRVVTPFEIRHSYNVCTLSYSMAYWPWERWERELDWQAMHGFNMIMAPVATEAIKERVWIKAGLTQAEIDQDTTSPAYLSWYRMGNMCHFGGPLSKEWHADQIALQHKTLKRMRELGIQPVVQSLAGFVPKAFARIHPETKLRQTEWCGFEPDCRTTTMEAADPQFAVLTKSYMDEWKKEFGPAKYFLVDSFNEMSPPRNRPLDQYFGEYGANLWKAIHDADANAVWTMQGWMFSYGLKKKIWNMQTVNALLKTVPDDQMLILDYSNEGGIWGRYCDERGAFGGKNWAMGYAPNMGGHTEYIGVLPHYAALPAATLKSPKRGNLKGISNEGEGIENNTVIHELICDSAWHT